MQYNEWLGEWLETYVRPTAKHSTYLRYESVIRLHIAPGLGKTELGKIDGLKLQKEVIRLLDRGNARDGKGLAANTVGLIVMIVQTSLEQAARLGIVRRQYADEICCPKGDTANLRIRCFTEREQKSIEEYVIEKKENKYYGILITLYMGLRIGELLALTWEDIDMDKGLLTVSKTCRDSWGNGCKKTVSSPKTQSSFRTIPIPKQIMPYLRRMKKKSNGKYVVDGAGKEISVRSYQRTFERVLRRLNIPHRGFHSLRHTFATRAIENGVDVKTLSEVMGHKSPSITLGIYAHSLAPHKRSMMDKLGNLLSETVRYAEADE